MTEYVTVWRDHEPTKLRWGIPVVRCKDCYYFTDSPAWPNAHECDYINRAVEPDGFCAWGEVERPQKDMSC